MKFFKFILGFIILTGLFLRIKLYFSSPSLWYDECSLVWNIETLGFKDLFKPLVHVQQVAPPLFLVFEKLLYIIVSNLSTDLKLTDIVLRFPAFISGCLSIPLFAYLTHKIYKNHLFTIICTAIISLNVWMINYSNEVKQYGIETIIGILFLLLFSNTNFKNFSLRKISLLSLFCILSVWLSSEAIIYIIIASVIILINNKDKKKLILFFAPIILNTILYYFSYYKPNIVQYGNYMQDFWGNSFFYPNTFFKDFLNQYFVLFPDIPFDKIINTKLLFLLFYGLSILNIIFGIQYSKKHPEVKNIFIFCCIVPLIIILAGFMHAYPYSDRLIIFLIPIYSILTFQFLLYIKHQKFISILLNIVILFFCILKIKVALVNPNFFAIHKSDIRSFYQILIKNNPEQKNLIVDESHYMCYSKGKGEIVLSPDNITELKNLPDDDYFVIVGDTYKNSYRGLTKDIYQNFNVIKYIGTKNDTFFAQIRIKEN